MNAFSQSKQKVQVEVELRKSLVRQYYLGNLHEAINRLDMQPAIGKMINVSRALGSVYRLGFYVRRPTLELPVDILRYW